MHIDDVIEAPACSGHRAQAFTAALNLVVSRGLLVFPHIVQNTNTCQDSLITLSSMIPRSSFSPLFIIHVSDSQFFAILLLSLIHIYCQQRRTVFWLTRLFYCSRDCREDAAGVPCELVLCSCLLVDNIILLDCVS